MGTAGRSVDDLLNHIVLWGNRAGRFLKGKTREDFLADELLQAAISKCIEAIGEACGSVARLHPEFQQQHPELDLVEAYRARNRLSHGYDTIDWSIVWDTATAYVPSLTGKAAALLSTNET